MKNLKNLLVNSLYELYEDQLVEFIFDPKDYEDDIYILGDKNQLVLSPYDSIGTIRVLVMDYDYNELVENYHDISELMLFELDSYLKALN